MIPVLGIPVINRPDLLRQTLASIDEPVERLVVIDNSGTGTLGDEAIGVRPDAIIVDPPGNLGVAASWNFVIRTTPAAPWWCLVNADITFAPGDLYKLYNAMETAPIARLVQWGAFGIRADAVERVGFFDEAFHPVYCEDADYEWRCQLAGVGWIDLPNNSTHVGSAALNSDPHFMERNAHTYPANRRYYEEKWGGPLRGGERFQTPFDKGGSVADWTLQLRRLRDLSWD